MPADLPDLLRQALVSAGLQRGRRVAVAFSGGLDSTALLHAAAGLQADLGFVLQAVHVHHGLQAQADAWARHCAAVAGALGLAFHCRHVQVRTTAGQGVEAAARTARYAALAGVEADAVLLAHHADDQAETVLLALLRGAGPAGLAAMGSAAAPPAHPLHGRLLRPWLGLPRSAIAAWAEAQGLHWVEDPSNQHTRLDRNFLRLQVLPALAQRFPGWRQSLARSAAWNAEALALLGELAAQDAAGFRAPLAPQADPACLPGWVAEWRVLTPLRQRNLLRALIQQRGVPAPPAARLQSLLDQLGAADDRLPAVAWQGWALRRWANRLWLEHSALPAVSGGGSARLSCAAFEDAAVGSWPWSGRAAAGWLDAQGVHWQMVPWPTTAAAAAAAQCAYPGLQPQLLQPLRADCGALELRWNGGQARLQLHPGGPHRDLRKLFQESGVPPWRRHQLARLYSGRQLVAVAGIGTAPDWQAAVGSGQGWQLLRGMPIESHAAKAASHGMI